MSDSTIQSIISNPQATHNQVVVNSVAKALLQLRHHYYPNPQDLESDYIKCVDLLNSLTVHDFIKGNVEPDPALATELPALIQFLINKTKESIDHNLDIVTLYNGESEERISLIMRDVVTLVVKALLDDEKFAHSYEGSFDERLAQAQADRPLRLLSLFKCLQRLRIGICNTGCRNELVSLLNGVYEGIEIMEDACSFVEYTLKDRLMSLVENVLQENLMTEELWHALYEWMTDNNAVNLLRLLSIGQGSNIHDELLAHFIKHGCNPATLSVTVRRGKVVSLRDYIENITSNLLYPNDMKRNVELSMIYRLLNENTESSNVELRNSALMYIQNWIRNSFTFTPPNRALLGQYYAVYVGHSDLLKNRALLLLSNKITEEEIAVIQQQFNEYYQTITNPQLSTELRASLKNLREKISECKKDTFYSQIENFFACFFLSDKNSKKEIYSLLLEDKVLPHILLTEQALFEWDKKIVEEGLQTFRDIGPYEINRIFLHAIITNPLNSQKIRHQDLFLFKNQPLFFCSF